MMTETSDSLLQNLHEFLLIRGIINPDQYESLKFSGGSNEDGSTYVALIPFIIRHNKMYTIVLPYRRVAVKTDQPEKPQDESSIEIIQREFFQETGLYFNSDYIFEVLPRRTVSSFRAGLEKHIQIFYAIRLGIKMVQKMKVFKGPNREDEEKAMPLFVEVSEIIKILASAHLVALRNLLTALINQDDAQMLIDTRSENDLILRHFRDLLEVAEKEIYLRDVDISD